MGLSASIYPTQSNMLAALRSFLLDVLPAGTEVIAGQANRVPEPKVTNFVVMTPMRHTRLRTNIDSEEDVRFVGSIADTVLTVTDVSFGTILARARVFGTGVSDPTITPNAAPTIILGQLTGAPGGIGTYTVSPSQTVSSVVMSSGARTLEQGAQEVIQLDFHSADASSGDMARTVTTAMRDPYATQQFAAQVPNYGVVPLHADDARQAPFINAEGQYESRWVVEAMIQCNVVISIPAQYADSVDVDAISVEATYPP